MRILAKGKPAMMSKKFCSMPPDGTLDFQKKGEAALPENGVDKRTGSSVKLPIAALSS